MAVMPPKPESRADKTSPARSTTTPLIQNPTEHSDAPTPVFAHLDAEQARTYSLVLAASGIAHGLFHRNGRWSIGVARQDRAGALRAISLYRAENPMAPDHDAPHPPSSPRSISALYVGLLLVVVHVAVTTSRQKDTLISTFGADARQIVDGDVYRCVTALLLHNDISHLLANLVGTLLFGTLVSGYCGWGIGWLLIVLSGALGNGLTALWYGDQHLSIGASTGIFAALGICAVMAFWRRYQHHGQRGRSWLSLAGALALLGWLGSSPRSDLAAHLFGLTAGFGFGGLCLWVLDRPTSRPMQTGSFFLTVALLLGSCWWGYAKGGT